MNVLGNLYTRLHFQYFNKDLVFDLMDMIKERLKNVQMSKDVYELKSEVKKLRKRIRTLEKKGNRCERSIKGFQ